MLKKILGKLIYKEAYSEETYLAHLKNNDIQVGEGTHFFDPRSTRIDTGRGNYIKFGKNCKITPGATIIAHDYSWTTCIDSNENKIYPSGGKPVEIGDNVFIGINATIIGPVKIGSNSIIGGGAVVCKDIPENSVAIGNPAKVIKNTAEYAKKLQQTVKESFFTDIDFFIKKHGHFPNPDECGRYMVLFLDKTPENRNKYLAKVSLAGVNAKNAKSAFDHTEKIFKDYSAVKSEYEKSRKASA